MSRTYKMTDPKGCLTHQLQTGGSGGEGVGVNWLSHSATSNFNNYF